MIKKTLYFGNPSYMHTSLEQLCFQHHETKEAISVPIEDIAIILLDNPQITLSHALIIKLLTNNVAIISCNDTHHPFGLMLPLEKHSEHSERVHAQAQASNALKNNLWQQIVIAKIQNQAMHLATKNKSIEKLLQLQKNVQLGDKGNKEAQAAIYYWRNIFPKSIAFTRDRFGQPPNHLLNYGYAILRSIVARGLVGSGLLPSLGIYHKNKYNAYCLADDVMEPYRPFVDQIVCNIIETKSNYITIDKEIKQMLLSIASSTVIIKKEKYPLMIALEQTTASLAKCYMHKSRKIIYPEFYATK